MPIDGIIPRIDKLYFSISSIVLSVLSKISKINIPEINFKISCSKGTYIRSLANDYGTKLNCGAHLKELKRTAIGDYKLENSISIEDFEKKLK